MDSMEPEQKKLKSVGSASANIYDISKEDMEIQTSTLKVTCTSKSINIGDKNGQNNNTEEADSEDDTSVTNNDDDDSFTFPPDDNVNDMLTGVKLNGKLPTPTERYFTLYYKINVQKPNNDICILVHTNRICMISLAPSHSVLTNNNKITKVDFRVSDKLDRASNKVSGKSKHGAQPLQTNSNICVITCSDGSTHMIKCCIIGKLVEVNEMLLENPELLREPPHKGGYLAIVLPNIKLLDKMKEELLTKEEYESVMLKQFTVSSENSAETISVVHKAT